MTTGQSGETTATTDATSRSHVTPGEAWPSMSEVLAPYVDRAPWLPEHFKHDPQLRRELDVFLTVLNSSAYFYNLFHDVDYPDFWPCYSTAFPIGFNNPDDVYLITAVEDTGVYRITGYRGTVHILQFEVGSSPMQTWGFGEFTSSVREYEPDRDAEVAANGRFDVVLSTRENRPVEHVGDWWEMQPGAMFVMIRKRSYDWAGEIDARIAIDRVDVPALRPRRSEQEIARRVGMLHTTVRNWAFKMAAWFESLADRGLVNQVAPYSTLGGIDAQTYHHGIFEIAEDEALVLDTDVPEECRYWMWHVTDQIMSSIDQVHRRSSLNGFTAELDPDGRLRAVISAADPGVPNWLDTGGHLRGGISGRWWSPSVVPEPRITRVKLDDLRDHLHPGTRVVSLEERDAEIRERRRATQLRVRW